MEPNSHPILLVIIGNLMCRKKFDAFEEGKKIDYALNGVFGTSQQVAHHHLFRLGKGQDVEEIEILETLPVDTNMHNSRDRAVRLSRSRREPGHWRLFHTVGNFRVDAVESEAGEKRR
ncbi:hypothetical protein RF11_13401 [Thelohanellus kitauei]|uniref:Uncharacterized protein n=1 Tax=Thelohanellus kitauei TaxID=669202 RepID=A0A0C2ITV8_THEKT|nr:hypothetical protein RF11_13401 [Thelohanellus kitauei]